jgi:hypothetical protein
MLQLGFSEPDPSLFRIHRGVAVQQGGLFDVLRLKEEPLPCGGLLSVRLGFAVQGTLEWSITL